jgi:hypothetical protein
MLKQLMDQILETFFNQGQLLQLFLVQFGYAYALN